MNFAIYELFLEEDIICPWVRHADEKIPDLLLPESSSDLVFESEYLFPVAEVSFYRVCRIYGLFRSMKHA
jgi:hypothetical protein